MRLKIETNETTKEKIVSGLKGSFDARKDHMTREALRAGTSVGDEDRDFATGMNVARTYGMPLVSVSAAALAGFAAHMEAESYDRVLHGKTRIDSSDGESSGTESLSSSVKPEQPSAGDATTSADSYKNPAAHSGGSYMEPLHTPGVPPISSGQNMPGSSIAPAMRDVYHQSAVRHSNNTFSDSSAKGNGITTYNQDMPAAPGIGGYNPQSGASGFPAGIPVSKAVQVTAKYLNHHLIYFDD